MSAVVVLRGEVILGIDGTHLAAATAERARSVHGQETAKVSERAGVGTGAQSGDTRALLPFGLLSVSGRHRAMCHAAAAALAVLHVARKK